MWIYHWHFYFLTQLLYIAVNQSIAAKNDPFDVNKFSNPTKDDNDTYITDTIKNQKERDSEAKKNSLYYWRSAYPHCSNVYAGTKIKGKGVDYFPNPHEESKLKQNVFNNGGVAFLINPLAESDLKSDNYPDTLFKNFYSSAKLEVAKDISLDDLADAAFRNAYLQTSLKTEAAKS